MDKALEAFISFAKLAVQKTADGWAWKNCSKDRICDWFGPSDFGLLQHFAALPATDTSGLVERLRAVKPDRCDYCKDHGFQYPNLCEDCRLAAERTPFDREAAENERLREGGCCAAGALLDTARRAERALAIRSRAALTGGSDGE